MRGRPMERFEDLPGPGEYDLRKEGAVSGPAPTIQGRPKLPPTEALPGPGQYDLPVSKAPAFTMGLPIKPLAQDPVPDPGQYDLPEAWRAGGGFSIPGKAKEVPAEDSPGPGEYHSSLHGQIGRDAPAFTMRGRLAEAGEGEEGSPGPGDHFNPETDPFLVGKGGPAFTMRTKVNVVREEREEEDQRQLPGPGHFIGPSYVDPGSPSAPSYTMRGRVKEAEAPPSPGPAQYELDRGLKRGPSFTMRAKPAEREILASCQSNSLTLLPFQPRPLIPLGLVISIPSSTLSSSALPHGLWASSATLHTKREPTRQPQGTMIYPRMYGRTGLPSP